MLTGEELHKAVIVVVLDTGSLPKDQFERWECLPDEDKASLDAVADYLQERHIVPWQTLALQWRNFIELAITNKLAFWSQEYEDLQQRTRELSGEEQERC